MDAETVTITRYPNRRLYDHRQSKYVTLPEIEKAIQSGATVAVRDSKTGADLTRSLLAQIILERYPERLVLFPIPLLHTIIRANDLVLGFLRDYLRLAMTYLEGLQQSSPFNPVMGPLDWMKAFLLTDFQPQPKPASSPAANAAPSAEELVRRVAELERRLAELETSGDSSALNPSDPAEPGTGGSLEPERKGV